jgi:ribonuclease Z
MLSEAIDVGNAMNAKFTLLTHFSQHYMMIPYFKSEVKGQVGITYDNMRVSQFAVHLISTINAVSL